jgi:hypothetical protein
MKGLNELRYSTVTQETGKANVERMPENRWLISRSTAKGTDHRAPTMAAIIQVISCPPHMKLIGSIIIATARALETQHSRRPQPGLFDRTHIIMNTGKSQVNVGTTRSPRENCSNTNAINSARNENHLGKGLRIKFIVATSSDSDSIYAALWPPNRVFTSDFSSLINL